MDIAVPALPERYRVYREVGRGGQGVVVHARDEVLGADVALKIIRPDLAGDASVLERMRREALLSRRVNHPGVCRVHDLVTTPSATFLVMDYVEGLSLAALLARDRIAVERALTIVTQAAEAVSAAHAAGVVHRDLKPHNIIVAESGPAVVVDFGVATATDLPKLTATDIIVGTRAYIAPEIWLGAPATALADVFALGVILYEALTGTVPYGDLEAAAVASAVPPSQRRPDIPVWLDDVVLKAMAPMPRDRFQSMRAFADALALAGPVSDTVPLAPAPKRASASMATTTEVVRRPIRWRPVVGGALVVATGLASAAIAYRVTNPPHDSDVVDAGVASHLVQHDASPTLPIASAAPIVDAGTRAASTVDAGLVDTHATTTHATATLAQKRKAALAELLHERSAKNLLPRDAPALDRAIAEVQHAKSEKAIEDASSSGKKAAAAVTIDASFLDRKLLRLNAAYNALDGDAKARVGKHLSRASQLIASQNYADANVALNEGFAGLPPTE